MSMMPRSVGGLVAAAADRFGEKSALIVAGQRWSFSELDKASSKVASYLASLGVGVGDRATLYAPNSAEWVIAYYGVLKSGASVNPLNLMLTPAEAAFAIGDCGARVVFGSDEKISGLASTDIEHRIAWGDHCPDGTVRFSDILEQHAPDWTMPDIHPLAISTVCYTSGTTGHPKGAELSHLAILLNTAMTATMHVRTEADIVVSALPCSHVYGNIVMNSAIAYGMTLILHPTFDADTIMASIEDNAATIFEGVPTMYFYMLASPRLSDFDLSSLTRCTVGGQTMPIAKMEEVVRAFGCPLIELWGMTEIGGLGTTHSAYGPARLGSIGVPLPHLEARIVLPAQPDRQVATGEIGELQIRGPMVMRGYANRPDATADAILPGNWLRTGDLAHVDEDGYIYIVDRLKDVIITGGFNVYPAELERAIAEHPAVAMVAVAGAPDDLKGEIAKAYVVLRPDATLDAVQLEVHCRDRLAAYKIPRAFSFVDDLPKTSSGKILRRNLADLDIIADI